MATIHGIIPNYSMLDESGNPQDLNTPEDTIVFYVRDGDPSTDTDGIFQLCTQMIGSDNNPFFHVQTQRQFLDQIVSDEVGDYYVVTEENRASFPSWGKDVDGYFLVL